MPKFKPHSGMKKRVKLTGSGKLRREQTNRRHLLEYKSSSRKRRLDGTSTWPRPTCLASRRCSVSDRSTP